MARKLLIGMDVSALEKSDAVGVTKHPANYAYQPLVADVDEENDDDHAENDDDHAGDAPTGPLREYKTQRSLLAERLAVTAGAFIRCLAGLEQDGVIEMST